MQKHDQVGNLQEIGEVHKEMYEALCAEAEGWEMRLDELEDEQMASGEE